MSIRSRLRRRSTWVLILAVIGLVSGSLSLALATAPAGAPQTVARPTAAGPTEPAPGAPAPKPAQRPNLVFVLADDLDTTLLRFMPAVRRMQATGADFRRYSVSNSLCCPSRATILTGRYPHNTEIFANSAPDGGFARFRASGLEDQTWAVTLQRAGYRTGLLGKYLNGYRPDRPVPPGWDTWAVTGDGYRQYDYTLNVDGHQVRYGDQASDYLTDVLAERAEAFVRESARAGRPFALEVSTFAPHAPYVPAPRDRSSYPGLRAPQGRAFDEEHVSDKPRVAAALSAAVRCPTRVATPPHTRRCSPHERRTSATSTANVSSTATIAIPSSSRTGQPP